MRDAVFKPSFTALVVLATVFGAAGLSRADVIDFTHTQGLPDLNVNDLHVSYNSVSKLFRAWSSPDANNTTPQDTLMFIDKDGDPNTAEFGVYGTYSIELTLTVDSSGNATGATGALTITGDLYSDDWTNYVGTGTFTAQLLAFDASSAATGEFRFLWNQTSGLLVDNGVFGSELGTILAAKPWGVFTNFNSDFRTDMLNVSGQSTSDTFGVVPSPAALPAGILMLGGLAFRRGRRTVS